MDEVQIITGNSHTDTRGTISFVNLFDFAGVKRFYQIANAGKAVVRAWQGHKIEHKYFYVAKGSFVLAWVKIDDWDKPSSSLKAAYRIFKGDEPAVLSVPPGYANGIKACEEGSLLTVYSNLSLEQSTADRWSFDSSLWLNWNGILI